MVWAAARDAAHAALVCGPTPADRHDAHVYRPRTQAPAAAITAPKSKVKAVKAVTIFAVTVVKEEKGEE